MRFGHRFESRYYQRSTLNDGLTVAWPLNEASGTRYPDYGGTEFNLTDVNTVGTADAPTGIGGLCASFDGSTEYLYCADPFAPPTGLSISLWAYQTGGSAAKMLLTQGATADSNGSFFLYLSALTPRFELSANGTTVTSAASAAVSGSTWAMLTGTWDGTTIRAYTNTVAGSPVAFSSALFNSTAPLGFGANRLTGTPANFFGGRIAQPLIFNRVLTATEITYLYNGGNGRPLSDWLA